MRKGYLSRAQPGRRRIRRNWWKCARVRSATDQRLPRDREELDASDEALRYVACGAVTSKDEVEAAFARSVVS